LIKLGADQAVQVEGYAKGMPHTSIKVTTETRDRIKDLGGKYEDTLTEALDLLEAARFWEQAEEGKRWLDSLSDEEQAERRARQDAIDQAFTGR
jgi:hypothetical protein